MTTDLPLVSLVVLCYNQKQFLEHALISAFAQDYPNLEIIVSDDCSTDGSDTLLKTIVGEYEGAHNVQLYINSSNLGLAVHVNEVLNRCKGNLVVWAAGDDISKSNRVSEIVKLWMENDCKAFSIHSAVELINETGEVVGERQGEYSNDIFSNLMNTRTILGASHAMSIESYHVFGALNDNVTEDITFAFRSSLLGEILYIDKPLVQYRLSVSHWKGKGAQDSTKIDRYKNGVLTIANFAQMLKDLNTYKKKFGSTSDHNKIQRAINEKLSESLLFVALFDKNVKAVIKHVLTKGIGIGELKAIKRIAKRVRRKLKSKWS